MSKPDISAVTKRAQQSIAAIAKTRTPQAHAPATVREPRVIVVKRKPEPTLAPAPIAKAKPKPIYVMRPLLNGDEVIAWAKGQGFKTALAADDLHVTIAYSKTPINWQTMGDDWRCEPMPQKDFAGGLLSAGCEGFTSDTKRKAISGGGREMRKLGSAIVLCFDSVSLTQRWCDFRAAGASWDHPGYQPHITITYNGEGIDLADIDPYEGDLLFGEEDWSILDGKPDNPVEKARANEADIGGVSVTRKEFGKLSDRVMQLAREHEQRSKAS